MTASKTIEMIVNQNTQEIAVITSRLSEFERRGEANAVMLSSEIQKLSSVISGGFKDLSMEVKNIENDFNKYKIEILEKREADLKAYDKRFAGKWVAGVLKWTGGIVGAILIAAILAQIIKQ